MFWWSSSLFLGIKDVWVSHSHSFDLRTKIQMLKCAPGLVVLIFVSNSKYAPKTLCWVLALFTEGFSGCLIQYENDDKNNPPRCLGFCLRSLKQNEIGYSLCLLENASLSFIIDYFQRYLEGVMHM